VHRDLKPANVLVADDGTPRLLDFGIAKVLRSGERESATATMPGSAPLTVRYASPEQLREGVVGVTTDVYSLGVILYELLTGRLVHDAGGLTPARTLEVIARRPATPPSVVVSRMLVEAALARGNARHPGTVAAARGSDPARLRRQLRGDLDAVVLRALAHEPADRFPSVEAFAADLRRFLAGEPVASRRIASWQRAWKVLRRNPLPASLAASALLLVIVFGGHALVQARRLEHESAAARAQALEATRARAEAEQANRFLLSLFDNEQAGRVKVAPEAARAILDVAADRLEHESGYPPGTRERLRLTVARAYRAIGGYNSARDAAERVLAAGRRGQATPLEAADALHEIGLLDLAQGRAAQARAALTQAYARREAVLGEHDPRTLDSLLHLASAEHRSGAGAIAASHLESARLRTRGSRGAGSLAMADVLHELGRQLAREHRIDDAAPALERALSIRRAHLGPRHAAVADTTLLLGTVAAQRGRWEEAERRYREALEVLVATRGERHPQVAQVLHSLAHPRLEPFIPRPESIRMLETAAAINGSQEVANPVAQATNLEALADLHVRDGRLSEAERLMLRVLDLRSTALGPEDPAVGLAMSNLAGVIAMRGECARARPMYLKAQGLVEAVEGRNHLFVAIPLHGMAMCRLDEGRPDEAVTLLREASAILDALHIRAGHPAREDVARDLATAEAAAGRAEPPRS
jgi:tetratricopeptide (TPR) repeat protein